MLDHCDGRDCIHKIKDCTLKKCYNCTNRFVAVFKNNQRYIKSNGKNKANRKGLLLFTAILIQEV